MIEDYIVYYRILLFIIMPIRIKNKNSLSRQTILTLFLKILEWQII